MPALPPQARCLANAERADPAVPCSPKPLLPLTPCLPHLVLPLQASCLAGVKQATAVPCSAQPALPVTPLATLVSHQSRRRGKPHARTQRLWRSGRC